MSGINRDDWLRAVEEAEAVTVDPSAVTIAELGDVLGLRKDATIRRVSKLIALGKATAVQKWIKDRSGRPQRVNAYRLT